MSEATEFLKNNGTDAATVMAALDAAEIESEQDWENEATVWTFDDGSKIKVSGPVVEVL